MLMKRLSATVLPVVSARTQCTSVPEIFPLVAQQRTPPLDITRMIINSLLISFEHLRGPQENSC